MKQIITTLMMAAAALGLLAADTATTTQAAKSIDTVFKAREWSFESAYTLRTEDFDKYKDSVTIGGNYFVTRGAGFHAGVGLNDLKGQGVDLVEFGLAGRVPLDKIRTALIFGVGAEHRFVNDKDGTPGGGKKNEAPTPGREDTWAVYAEAGASFRLHDHIEPFVKVRGIRPTESAKGEHVAILLGASIPFGGR